MSVGAIFASSGLSLPFARVVPHTALDSGPAKEGSTPLRDLFTSALLEAVDALQVSPRQRHKGIHSARKAMRRARSILQIAGPDLGAEAQACERTIKSICRDLSSARDAQAQVDALDRLVTKDRMTLAPDVLARTRRFLVRRRTRVVQGLLARDPEFRTLRARLTNARDAAKSLDWNSVRLEDVTSALARTVRRALKISQRARVSDREDVRHGWRRRMRRSVQQRAVFAGLGRSPGGAEEGNGTASVISEEGTMQAFTDLVRLLGLEHDLRVLQMTFANAGRFSPGERATLSVAIETEIRRIARKCDRQLYDDEPVVAFEDGE